ncbi:MAG: heme peroxidase, partial [Halomonadaceae bacterium]
ENYISRLPNINAVADLYKRPEGTEGKLSHNSSVLFPAFAMWFTDGFLRSDPKDIRKNLSNHQIDLCQIYGLNEEVTHQLRSGKEGKFKYQEINGEVYPPYAYRKDGTLREAFNGLEFFPTGHKLEDTVKPRKTRLFAMGTPQSNSTPGYIAFNTLMLREHNRIADELMNAYPAWDDERLFQTARNIMIVQLIKIVVEEYINHIAPVSFKFRADPSFTYDEDWYRSNWMTLEFNILYRWHALYPTAMTINNQPVTFDEFMYNTDLVVDRGLSPLMDDMTRQQACQPCLFNTPYFLHEIERKNLHLCRAHRVQSYNAYREHFSLPKAQTFRDISTDPEILEALQKLYKTVDDVEFYVGLYAEDRGPTSLFGPLLSVMVAVDAFSQALTNPLLAKNVFNVDTFSQVGMDIINNTHRIADILHRNTGDAGGLACSLSYVG